MEYEQLLASRSPRGFAPERVGRFPGYAVGAGFINVGLFLKSVLSERRSSFWSSAARAAIRDLPGTGWIVRDMLADPLPPLARVFLDARP